MTRLGIFGGSFNPIHNGHVHLMNAMLRQLNLDQLLLIPAGEAPHKPSTDYVSAEHRLEMCRLAAAQLPRVTVSDLEICRSGKSYTVDTLRILQQSQPEASLFLLIGSDMLLSFDQWKCWQEILQRCTLCVLAREAKDRILAEDKAEKLRPYGEILLLDTEPFPVSSTKIRQLIKNHQDFSCYLPENVVQYIARNRLYHG